MTDREAIRAFRKAVMERAASGFEHYPFPLKDLAHLADRLEKALDEIDRLRARLEPEEVRRLRMKIRILKTMTPSDDILKQRRSDLENLQIRLEETLRHSPPSGPPD